MQRVDQHSILVVLGGVVVEDLHGWVLRHSVDDDRQVGVCLRRGLLLGRPNRVARERVSDLVELASLPLDLELIVDEFLSEAQESCVGEFI